jgi:hypothetical protein
MKGWKTYVAAACLAGLGVVAIANGEVENGVQQLVAAGALVGLGHKLDKAAK